MWRSTGLIDAARTSTTVWCSPADGASRSTTSGGAPASATTAARITRSPPRRRRRRAGGDGVEHAAQSRDPFVGACLRLGFTADAASELLEFLREHVALVEVHTLARQRQTRRLVHAAGVRPDRHVGPVLEHRVGSDQANV